MLGAQPTRFGDQSAVIVRQVADRFRAASVEADDRHARHLNRKPKSDFLGFWAGLR